MRQIVGVVALIALAGQSGLQGELRAHDPSRVVKSDDGYYVYYTTGPRLPIRYSKDLVHWEGHANVMSAIPEWAHEHVPKGNSWIWAPDIFYDRPLKKWVILYAYSSFGSRRSAIGALTSPNLRIDSAWTDAGDVIDTVESDNYNAIDPCPVFDRKGNLWMSFGSWNTGIKIVPLDPRTLRSSGPVTAIAGADQTDMEASFVWHQGRYFYLFFNRGFCCRGVNSTYKILIGRATSVTGPYLDKSGLNCYGQGGGTLFLQTDGDMIGPGQAGVSPDGRIFSFHFYDKKLNGAPTFAMGEIHIDRDGWPVVTDIR